MAKKRRRLARPNLLGIAALTVLALVTVGVSWLALSHTTAAPPSAPENIVEAQRAHSTVEPLPTSIPTPARPPLVIAQGSKAVFFGDSWTAGYGADVPKEQGFAFVTGNTLGLDFTINQGGGTGYVNPGREGKGTYRERLAKAPVDPDVKFLVIQGGLNDENKGIGNLTQVVRDTFAQAKVTYPNAQTVVMGPLVPVRLPGLDIQIIDKTLHDLSDQAGFYYVSPQSEYWLDQTLIARYIDPAKENHPNTAGHKYVAGKLMADLQKFSS